MARLISHAPPLAQSTLISVVSCIAGTLKGRYGIDPVPVMNSVGIDPIVIQDSDRRLTVATLSPLWLRCVEVTGDEAFGLYAARYYQPAQFYGVDLALCTAATFGEALQLHVQFIRVLTTAALASLKTDADGNHRLEIHRYGPDRPTDAALDCFFHAFFIRLFERQTGLQVNKLLRRLELPRAAPNDPTPWLDLGIPVVFGSPCGAMVFKPQAWALPLPGANPLLLAQLEKPILRQLAQLRLPLPASALRALLADTLASGASLEQLALALQISASQLRSGLRSQGLNFSQLLDQAREAQAMVLLANPAFSLEQIATKLGFSGSSSFNRAFRRWKGDTPLNYRRQVLG